MLDVPKPQITYLSEDLRLEMIFKNNSDSEVIVEYVELWFKSEDGLQAPKHSVSKPTLIGPGCRSSVLSIPFDVDPALCDGTNYSSIKVRYSVAGGPADEVLFDNPYTSYIILNPVPRTRVFFISHKDPQDTEIANELVRHLAKVGFTGYVAECDPRPGDDIWKDKIMPHIDTCVGMVVLWTAAASADPERILKEVDRAKKSDKKTILVVDRGAEIPATLGGDREYMEAHACISSPDLVSVVRAIMSQYKRGSF